MKNSVWSESTVLPHFGSTEGNVKTDVLIIGGGLCGILCAYFLKQQGVDCLLAEGNRICSGITKNTTAKITWLHGLIYDSIIKQYGAGKAKMYLNANKDALYDYKKMCKNIECDFEILPSCTYTLKDVRKIENEVMALEKLGEKAKFKTKTPLPLDVKGAIYAEEQAQFNVLEFISTISKCLNIAENTFISEIREKTAIHKNGKITAEHIIVATHFPFINKHGSYFLKLYQHRSYVSAFENADNYKCMFVDEDLKGLSFRNYKNLLLIGGGSHRTGKQGSAWTDADGFAKKHYPKSLLKYQWATQDCMSLDGIPYIGQYSKSTHNMYVATGFNKWGMTSSMAAAKIICNMVTGENDDYAPVFSPQRSILKPQLAVNGFESATNLLTPSAKRCPHLGCALKWNKYEHTWDCPCHGSRFEEDGKLIDNPATGDIKKRL